jgi:hypothetical protein
MHNSGGSMLVNVFQSVVPAGYTYKVVRAKGSDMGFKGESGALSITQDPT